jgi:uncharacterized protein
MVKKKGFLFFVMPVKNLLLCGAILALALSLPTAAPAEADTAALIEVEAEGEVLAKPDMAALSFAVESQAPQVEEARTANALASEALLKAMKGLLQPEEKIQSVSYRVYPIYQQKEKVQAGQKIRTSEVTGYRVDHLFRVELRDLTRIGQVSDVALKNGANRVQGPYFDHTEKEKLQQQAAVLALQRARELATALAQAADLKVTRLKKASTAPAYRPVRMMAERALAAPEAAPETPIGGGEEKFQARVSAVFEAAP